MKKITKLAQSNEFTILTITLVVQHTCGTLLILHGDNWCDVHGYCEVCNREFDLEFFPHYVED